MIERLFKRMWTDERGNALMIGGAALPLILGSVGFAVDTIQWTLWKRELQRAADSAAYAGVYAKAQNTTVASAIARDIVNNNKTGLTILSAYPQITYPTHSSYTNGVRVTLGIQQSLAFSSMFMSSAPTITATATAAMVDDGEYCAIAKEDTAAEGIKIVGGANATLGCKAFSHSLNPTSAIDASGSYTFNTTGIGSVGGMQASVTGTASNALKPYQLPFPDPFENKYSTTVPGTLACGSQTANTESVVGGVTTLKPGCYKGGNAFKFTSGETILKPGTYYLDNADFDVSGTGTKISGTGGVTIILTGTNPGTIKITGGQVNLTAPTSGDYANMLILQSNSATLNNNNTLAGNGSSSFDGAFYMPRGDMNLSGGSGAKTKCAMMVSRRLVFSGNADLQNNTVGCKANMTVSGKVVRLVG